MKIKPVFIGIAVLGILLLLLSLSKVAQVWAANPRDIWNGTKAQPLTAKFLPQRSPLFVSLLVNPDRLSLLAQLTTAPSDRRGLRQELNDLKQQLQSNWLLDYAQDIQPWLGEELGYGVINLDDNQQFPNTPNTRVGHLLAFAAKDAQKAKVSLNNFWQRLAVNGSTLGFEQYQGESIVSTFATTASIPKTIASVTLDRFVLFADDLKVLRQAIDTWKAPSAALLNLETYRDRLQQISNNKIGVIYANLTDGVNQLPTNVLASFAVARAGDQVGLQLRGQFNNQNNQNNDQVDKKNLGNTLGNTSKQSILNLAKSIPVNSSFILGKNLNQTLQDLESLLTQASPISSSGATESPNSPQFLKQAIAALGITPPSLNADTLAWADNDYAIALVPRDTGATDWLIVTTNGASQGDKQLKQEAIASLEQLDRLVSDRLTVGKVSLQSQPVTVWTRLQPITSNSGSTRDKNVDKNNLDKSADLAGTLVAAHAQTNKHIYFSNSLTILETALHSDQKQAITSDRTFQNLLTKFPSDTLTYGYLNQYHQLLGLDLISKLRLNHLDDSLNSLLAKHLSQHFKVAGIAIAPANNLINSEVFLVIQ